MYKNRLRGEITVFLSLIFVLIFSLVLSVVQSAVIQTEKNYRRGEMDRVMESVFAEYQKELLQTYDIFALDSSYETEEFSTDKILKRCDFYGQSKIDKEITKIQFLTDHEGQAFLEQVTAFMKQKIPLPEIEKLQKQSEKNESELSIFEKEGKDMKENMDQLMEQQDQELVQKETPLQFFSEMKNIGIVNMVMTDKAPSDKSVDLSRLPSKRELNKGEGEFQTKGESVWSKVYLGEYALDKFTSVVEPNEEGSLSYELEYLIGGTNSDRTNLRKVLNRISAIRFIPNYAYLLQSEDKKAEAEAAALVVSSIIVSPEITEVIKHGILLAWAYAESVLDLKSLVKGKKVPLMKTDENWKSKLSSLLIPGAQSVVEEETQTTEGLSYEDYIRILFHLIPEKESTMRTIDLIETGMKDKGFPFFAADRCVSKMELKNRCRIKRVTYEFYTDYEYR